MAFHQRVLPFSSSNAFASCTELGILMPNLCVQTQYFDFSFSIMPLRFSSTCHIHHVNSGSLTIQQCTEFLNICTWCEFFISLRFTNVLIPSFYWTRTSTPFFSLWDALFWYVLWWTRPTPLLQYRRTYGRQYPGIGHTNFLLYEPDKIWSPLLHCPQANICACTCNLPHTSLYPGLDYCGLCQLASCPCSSKSLSI